MYVIVVYATESGCASVGNVSATEGLKFTRGWAAGNRGSKLAILCRGEAFSTPYTNIANGNCAQKDGMWAEAVEETS